MIGFARVHSSRVAIEIEPGLSVYIASVPVLALLKFVAFLDRPNERDRDLQDLTQILISYPEADDERRFADDVFERGLSFDQAGPYVLGREMARFLGGDEAESVGRFLAKVRDEGDWHAVQHKMARFGPASWESDPRRLIELVDSLEMGLCRP